MERHGSPLILLVDDDPENTLAMMKVLARAGYGVVSAAHGYEALTKLSEQPFDLVITDLLMPCMSGLDLLRSVRAADPDIGVIVVTAFGEWASYVQAMNVGAMDYLSKPVRRQDVLIAVGKALARRGIQVPEVPRPDPEEVNASAA
jgi:DNA-binding NtrC family response regulator